MWFCNQFLKWTYALRSRGVNYGIVLPDTLKMTSIWQLYGLVFQALFLSRPSVSLYITLCFCLIAVETLDLGTSHVVCRLVTPVDDPFYTLLWITGCSMGTLVAGASSDLSHTSMLKLFVTHNLQLFVTHITFTAICHTYNFYSYLSHLSIIQLFVTHNFCKYLTHTTITHINRATICHTYQSYSYLSHI